MFVFVVIFLVMSFERYWVIMYLLKFWMKGSKFIIVICVIWVGSIFFVFFYIYVLGFKVGNCVENWLGIVYVKVYIMFVFIVLYVCLFCGIIIVYFRIGRKFYKDIKIFWVVMVDFEGGMIGR